MKTKHPMQPLVVRDGVLRFKPNMVLRDLVARGVVSLNSINIDQYPPEDLEQFWQLLGYSVSSYGSLDFVRKKTRDKADRKASELLATQKKGSR